MGGKILTLDLRSRMNYHMAHLTDSLSFPIDLCNEEFFVKWDVNHIMKDIIKNKEKLNLFKNRKRLFIYIIAGDTDVYSQLQNISAVFSTPYLEILKNNPTLGNKQALEDVSY